MTETLARILLALAIYGGECMDGYAPRYAKGLMEKVAMRRDLPPVACMVSSAYYEVGAWVLVYGVRTDRALRCQVVDVSGPDDRERHRRTRRIIEVAHENAPALCGSTKGRSADCPVKVWRP